MQQKCEDLKWDEGWKLKISEHASKAKIPNAEMISASKLEYTAEHQGIFHFWDDGGVDVLFGILLQAFEDRCHHIGCGIPSLEGSPHPDGVLSVCSRA